MTDPDLDRQIERLSPHVDRSVLSQLLAKMPPEAGHAIVAFLAETVPDTPGKEWAINLNLGGPATDPELRDLVQSLIIP